MAASASQPTASAPALASDPAVSGSASGPASAPKSAPASAPTPLAPAPTQKTTPATEEFLRATFGDSDDEDDIPNNLSQIENGNKSQIENGNNDKGDDNDDDNDDDDDDDNDDDDDDDNDENDDDDDDDIIESSQPSSDSSQVDLGTAVELVNLISDDEDDNDKETSSAVNNMLKVNLAPLYTGCVRPSVRPSVGPSVRNPFFFFNDAKVAK